MKNVLLKYKWKKHLSFAEKFLGIHFAEETPNDFYDFLEYSKEQEFMIRRKIHRLILFSFRGEKSEY